MQEHAFAIIPIGSESSIVYARAEGGTGRCPDGKVFLFGPLTLDSCFDSQGYKPFFICINFGEYLYSSLHNFRKIVRNAAIRMVHEVRRYI